MSEIINELKALEVKYGITYKDVRLGDLFVSQNGDTDIKPSHLTPVGIPVITSGETNFGILGLSNIPSKIINKNTITIDMFGKAYFRPFNYKMVTHARVFSLESNMFDMNSKTGNYIVTKLFFLPKLYSYDNMCSWNKIKNDLISLPHEPDGTLAIGFMEEFIATLERLPIR